MAYTLTWFGHSNFRLASDTVSLFIDPFFAGNPTAPVGFEQAGRPDLVLVTHDHGDHVGQAVEICKNTGATLVGVYDTVTHLVAKGLPEAQAVGMNLGGTVTLNGVAIKMVQALHSSASGCPAGYILTFPDGFCLYHAGDTALFSSMELFGRFHDIHLALLPIGGHFTMDANDAAYACKLLRARQVAPMHWGTFPVLAQGTDPFSQALETHAPDTALVLLTPGTPRAVGKALAPDQECGCD